jgi:choline dehydrogenase-like flavoprotein
LTYEEVEPYYDRIEQIIGVCGNDDQSGDSACGKKLFAPHPLALQRTHHEAGHRRNGHPPDSGAQGSPDPALR